MPLAEVLRDALGLHEGQDALPTTTTTTTGCPHCRGIGWLVARESGGGELVRCPCQRVARRQLGETLDMAKTFASFIPRAGAEEALAAARLVAEGEKEWLYLYSAEKGTGKTHLLHAVANQLQAEGRSVYLTSFRQLIRSVYRLRDEASGLDRFLTQLKQVDALIVDELRYRVTDWAWDHLHEVFDYRYQRRLTTCFASNYSPAALEGNALRLAAVDAYQTDQLDTLTSRLGDRRTSLIVENKAADYRPVAEV